MSDRSLRSSEPVWMEIARREIGVKELPGPGDNPRVVEYHKATTLRASEDAVPWCASFVSWCLESAGVESTFSARARSYESWGKALARPLIGCVVVLSRGPNPAQGHVGFYAGSHGPDHVKILGGNQGDAVSISAFPRRKVLGYRWPTEVPVPRETQGPAEVPLPRDAAAAAASKEAETEPRNPPDSVTPPPPPTSTPARSDNAGPRPNLWGRIVAGLRALFKRNG